MARHANSGSSGAAPGDKPPHTYGKSQPCNASLSISAQATERWHPDLDRMASLSLSFTLSLPPSLPSSLSLSSDMLSFLSLSLSLSLSLCLSLSLSIRISISSSSSSSLLSLLSALPSLSRLVLSVSDSSRSLSLSLSFSVSLYVRISLALSLDRWWWWEWYIKSEADRHTRPILATRGSAIGVKPPVSHRASLSAKSSQACIVCCHQSSAAAASRTSSLGGMAVMGPSHQCRRQPKASTCNRADMYTYKEAWQKAQAQPTYTYLSTYTLTHMRTYVRTYMIYTRRPGSGHKLNLS